MLGDLVESMKKAALEAVENNDPCCIMYGQVINNAPLQIMVNVKLILEEQQLVLTRNVTDFYTDVTVDWGTESALTTNSHGTGKGVKVESTATLTIESGGTPSHSHGGSVEIENEVSGSTGSYNLAHTHGIVGRKRILVHNSLQVGDEVILIRQAGGQEYIVLDRVG